MIITFDQKLQEESWANSQNRFETLQSQRFNSLVMFECMSRIVWTHIRSCFFLFKFKEGNGCPLNLMEWCNTRADAQLVVTVNCYIITRSPDEKYSLGSWVILLNNQKAVEARQVLPNPQTPQQAH